MAVNSKPIYGFIAGEVSPSFFGRTDLTKYELGVQLAKNFFVDYRGGLSSRPGLKFFAPIEGNANAAKLFRFKASGNDYLLVFGNNYFRPFRNGGYLLEAAKTITGYAASIIVSASHGFSNGDWVYISGVNGTVQLNGRYFQVANATTDTFELQLPNGGTLNSTSYGAYLSGGTVARTVRVASPFSAADLRLLNGEQQYNTMIFTSLAYDVYKLTYVNDTTWTLNLLQFGAGITRPSRPTYTASAVGTAGIAFAVTAVKDGLESHPSRYRLTSTSVNYSATAGSGLLEWPAVTGAEEYNVYRSLILPTGAQISAAQELGFIGRAYGPQFIDNNIVPDFTKTPPRGFNPFGDGQILQIAVNSAGTGYTIDSAVTVTDPTGSGFIGEAIVSPTGTLIGILVIDGGKNYTSPTVSVSVGSGATFTTTLSAASGNHPRVFTVFQQRGVYAGTESQPMTIWGSKPGDINNFHISTVPNAGDAYAFTLDNSDVKPILHLVALRNGLLAFTSTGVTLLRAEEGKAVSGVNALAEPQAYKGASETSPVTIDLDVLFAQENSSSLNAMMYTEYSNTFQLQDVSLLSNHLMGEGKRITRMEWAPEPSKLLWCLREDGMLLTLTYERVQEVFAWTQHSTRGRFHDICNVLENGTNVVYCVVERLVGGEWVKYLEAFQPRDFQHQEDFFGVDSGLSYPLQTPAAALSASGTSGTIVVTASAAVFSAADVGKFIYLGGGKGQVTAFTSSTQISVMLEREITSVLPESDGTIALPIAAGKWSIGSAVTVVTGLWHLEGQVVNGIADASVIGEQTVVNGSITLSRAATKITVGLPYKCLGKTLPLTLQGATVEANQKTILGVSIRLKESRGLAVGADFNSLVDLKDRTDVDWGDPISLKNEYSSISVNGGWQEDGVFCFQQSYPLPATLLGMVIDTVIGDD